MTILALKRVVKGEKKIKELKDELERTRHTLSSGKISFETLDQQEIIDGLSERISLLEKKQESNLDRIDVVRYFASDKDEGRSSYSIGITNEKKDGLVLTALMYRNGMNLYAKSINEGVSDYPLSDEEKEAVSRTKVTKVLG